MSQGTSSCHQLFSFLAPPWSQITTLSPFGSSFCVLRQGLCGSLCSQSWPHTYGTPPASAPQVVTLQAHITMPSPRFPLQWLLWLFLTLHPTCYSLRAWQLPASVTPSEALPCAPSLESQQGESLKLWQTLLRLSSQQGNRVVFPAAAVHRSVLLPYPARHLPASIFCVLAPSILPLLRGLGHSGSDPPCCFARPRASAQASFRFLFSQHPAEAMAGAQEDCRNCWFGIVKDEWLRLQVITDNQLSVILGDPAEPSCQLEVPLRQTPHWGWLECSPALS